MASVRRSAGPTADEAATTTLRQRNARRPGCSRGDDAAILLTVFSAIGNKAVKSSEPDDKQLPKAGNEVQRSPGSEDRPEAVEKPKKIEPLPEKPELDTPKVETDPVVNFKTRVGTFEMLVPERPFIWQGGDGEWRKFKYILTDVRFDVKRNDSLVHPYIATLSYNETTRNSVPTTEGPG